ncbi:hypothetical protein [Alicyclobacillus acidocaldarius]|uniref:Uncharacterized protein n=1 Tax=Alicyclobacillus acidocaldarius subsp. acidocaldarius (strain ATCC 27009 / DSM 446 / BCRC 14685 / JCM 5260 / KCTC 1825 / NBRC 15652 / NCIMB 11725 / NRRL B-14509 / 104-IA) TaxID=521098 RepID=C8WVJ2_ALIAD|nr:hypothetical protein [Alicyclobacillus acidocaldarius]ACV58114.1 hypothetical protein Aaci_1077 [Alicyclobacillus acidocaldarius subsp. acidocaldarius DSM 446]
MPSIVNLTPHELTFVGPDGEILARIPPSGQIARISSETDLVGEVAGLPVYKTVMGDMEGLPAPQPDTVYVASTLVAQAAVRAGRSDVYSPAAQVRDSEGRIVGCRGLQIPT